MSLSAKREALARIHGRYGRYGRAGRPHKTRILDEFCATCGYQRKAALRLLNTALRTTPPKRSGPKRSYEPAEVLPVLKAIWLASDQPCNRLLQAALPQWLSHHEGRTAPLPEAFKEKLLQISPAQIDRLLRPARVQHPKRGLSTTRPGTLALRQAVPTRGGIARHDLRRCGRVCRSLGRSQTHPQSRIRERGPGQRVCSVSGAPAVLVPGREGPGRASPCTGALVPRRAVHLDPYGLGDCFLRANVRHGASPETIRDLVTALSAAFRTASSGTIDSLTAAWHQAAGAPDRWSAAKRPNAQAMLAKFLGWLAQQPLQAQVPAAVVDKQYLSVHETMAAAPTWLAPESCPGAFSP